MTLAVARVSAWTSLVLAFWGALGVALFPFGGIGGSGRGSPRARLLSLRAGGTGQAAVAAKTGAVVAMLTLVAFVLVLMLVLVLVLG